MLFDRRRMLAGAALLIPGARAGAQAGGDSPVPDGAEVRKLGDGFVFTEGPAAGPYGRIYFSDIPNNRIHAYDPGSKTMAVHREQSGGANGLMWSKDGWLYACEGGARRVSRQKGDRIEAVAERFEGKRLNSPNDLCLDDHGGFYFTDPRYGSQEGRELDHESVYYVDRQGNLTRVAPDLRKPNGIILSRNGSVLHIADPGDRSIWSYPVTGPGKLGERRKLAPMGSDGMTIDERDNVYLTTAGAVWFFSPEGKELGKVVVPEGPANCTFGGKESRTLYITARRGFYAVDLKLRGGGR